MRCVLETFPDHTAQREAARENTANHGRHVHAAGRGDISAGPRGGWGLRTRLHAGICVALFIFLPKRPGGPRTGTPCWAPGPSCGAVPAAWQVCSEGGRWCPRARRAPHWTLGTSRRIWGPGRRHRWAWGAQTPVQLCHLPAKTTAPAWSFRL